MQAAAAAMHPSSESKTASFSHCRNSFEKNSSTVTVRDDPSAIHGTSADPFEEMLSRMRSYLVVKVNRRRQEFDALGMDDIAARPGLGASSPGRKSRWMLAKTIMIAHDCRALHLPLFCTRSDRWEGSIPYMPVLQARRDISSLFSSVRTPCQIYGY